MASSQTASGPGSPSSSSSSSLQIRLTRLDEGGVGSLAPGSVAALQIPLQITHLGETFKCFTYIKYLYLRFIFKIYI